MKTKKFWTVVNFESDLWPCNRLVQFEIRQDAIEQAKELASKYKQEYVVLRAEQVYAQRPVPVGVTILR